MQALARPSLALVTPRHSRPAQARPARLAKAQPDSYEKVEEPVRGESVSYARKDVRGDLDKALESDALNPNRALGGQEVGVTDAMRFQGAAPEVINSRLAMIGFLAAAIAHKATGKNIWEQIQSWPNIPLTVVAVITFALLVPIVRGQPRRSFGAFTSDAELTLGRWAMLGVVILFWWPFAMDNFYLF